MSGRALKDTAGNHDKSKRANSHKAKESFDAHRREPSETINQTPPSSNTTMSTVADITADLKALYNEKNCGPIMIRLSWHDAGVYSTGAKTGGCPNAAMRFTDGGEGCFGANAGE